MTGPPDTPNTPPADRDDLAERLALWLDLRYGLSPDQAISTELVEKAITQVASVLPDHAHPEEWLKLGYTIIERRAIDYFRSPRSRTMPRGTMDFTGSEKGPAEALGNQDLALKATKLGIQAANDADEVFLWTEWITAMRHGERINLRRMSERIWPHKHEAHASRVISRLLRDVSGQLANDFYKGA